MVMMGKLMFVVVAILFKISYIITIELAAIVPKPFILNLFKTLS
jgi:hypothetical protein